MELASIAPAHELRDGGSVAPPPSAHAYVRRYAIIGEADFSHFEADANREMAGILE